MRAKPKKGLTERELLQAYRLLSRDIAKASRKARRLTAEVLGATR